MFRASLSTLCRRKLLWRMSTMADHNGEGIGSYETLAVSRPSENVVQVEMNRPEKRNAMSIHFLKFQMVLCSGLCCTGVVVEFASGPLLARVWRIGIVVILTCSEVRQCFRALADDKDCRSIVLTGAGKLFSAGIDLMDLAPNLTGNSGDVSRKGWQHLKFVSGLQESFNAIEKCSKPVIAAVHSGCIGGGVDLIAACDIRLCSEDAWFQIKEVDLGITADLGTLQRLPKIVGNHSLVRELAYTARTFDSSEAKGIGLVSRVLADREACIDAALQLAADIASKSPVAVQGTKVNLIYSRDHTVDEGLEFVAVWNGLALQSEDIVKAVQSAMTKTKPTFSKL